MSPAPFGLAECVTSISRAAAATGAVNPLAVTTFPPAPTAPPVWEVDLPGAPGTGWKDQPDASAWPEPCCLHLGEIAPTSAAGEEVHRPVRFPEHQLRANRPRQDHQRHPERVPEPTRRL